MTIKYFVFQSESSLNLLTSIDNVSIIVTVVASALCYDPSSLTIFKGDEIIWKNDDTSAHTVSSGNIIDGPNDKFDSGLIMSGKTFVHKFEGVGEYDYFCTIHPWANASITVK